MTDTHDKIMALADALANAVADDRDAENSVSDPEVVQTLLNDVIEAKAALSAAVTELVKAKEDAETAEAEVRLIYEQSESAEIAILQAENERLKESATLWNKRYTEVCQDRADGIAVRFRNGELVRERDALQAKLAALEGQVPQEWTNLLAYVLQDDMHNRLTPRVIDIAYTAFMQAKQPNAEDGGASDWFNDTKPKVKELIAKLRKDLVEELTDLAAGAAPKEET